MIKNLEGKMDERWEWEMKKVETEKICCLLECLQEERDRKMCILWITFRNFTSSFKNEGQE